MFCTYIYIIVKTLRKWNGNSFNIDVSTFLAYEKKNGWVHVYLKIDFFWKQFNIILMQIFVK